MINLFEKYICLILALINFASFFWSVLGVFKKKTDMDYLNYRLLQVASLLTWLSLAFDLVNSNSSKLFYMFVTVILFVCLLIFWFHVRIVKRNNFSIAYSKDKPAVLVKEGLYKYIRHPFYFTYLLCYISITAFFGSIFSIILTFVMLLVYYKAARFEESKFNNSSLNSEYKEYMKCTGMFIPKVFF